MPTRWRQWGEKIAAEDSQGYRPYTVAGAAALPFAGMIGEQRFRADQGVEVKDLDALSRKVRKGDIVLSGKVGPDRNKTYISLVGGNPDQYHAAVVGHGRELDSLLESSPGAGMESEGLSSSKSRLTVVRPNDPKAAKRMVAQMQQRGQLADKLEQDLVSRLQASGMSLDDAEHWAYQARRGMYQKQEGIAAGLKNLLLPKIRGITDRGAAARTQAEAEELKKLVAASQSGAGAYDDLLKRLVPELQRLQTTTPEAARDQMQQQIGKLIPDCARGVCSTAPAKGMGASVVPGKGATSVLPSDFLRSKEFQTVARYNPEGAEYKLLDKLLRHGPTLSRGLIGAGLAGGLYGGYKLYDKLRQPSPMEQLGRSIGLK